MNTSDINNNIHPLQDRPLKAISNHQPKPIPCSWPSHQTGGYLKKWQKTSKNGFYIQTVFEIFDQKRDGKLKLLWLRSSPPGMKPVK